MTKRIRCISKKMLYIKTRSFIGSHKYIHLFTCKNTHAAHAIQDKNFSLADSYSCLLPDAFSVHVQYTVQVKPVWTDANMIFSLKGRTYNAMKLNNSVTDNDIYLQLSGMTDQHLKQASFKNELSQKVKAVESVYLCSHSGSTEHYKSISHCRVNIHCSLIFTSQNT